MKNSLERIIPQSAKAFKGSDYYISRPDSHIILSDKPTRTAKFVDSIKQAIVSSGLTDGMTVSFHHHLRNGDYVLNLVLEQISLLGIKNLTVAASSIFPIHAPLVKHIENKTVTKIYTSYINGAVADAVLKGKLANPMIMQTHGGRARAIECGELHIDVAFIACPTVDKKGNGCGSIGKSRCGSLGYAIADYEYADKVVLITDNIVEEINTSLIDLNANKIDYVVKVDEIGDNKGIVSGTTKVTTDPVGLMIARLTTRLLDELGLIKDGMSFQTGAGGTSLAVADRVREQMTKRNIKGSFASGGINGYFVSMLKNNLLDKLYDVQCFDIEAIDSIASNPNHIRMSASMYANPYNPNVVVNNLDFVILGATEIDLDYNVNVTTASDGRLIGGSGGHSDTAYGAKVSIITTALIKSRLPIVLSKVTCVTTPGEDIDILVTERGIAINPKRTDLLAKLANSKLPICTIQELYDKAISLTGKPNSIKFTDKVVALVEYRDGSIIDAIYKPYDC